MKIDRRLIVNFDWPLLFLVLGMCAAGLLNIYSAGYSLRYLPQEPYYIKQLKWVALGIVFMIFTFSIDYRTISRYAYLIYAVSILLLISVLVFGKTAQGAQRWIVLGGFTFQPSELIKLSLILVMARFFEERGLDGPYRLRDLLIPFILLAVPFTLILIQPDLGTALMLFFIFIAIVFFIGIYWKSLILAAAGFLLATPLCWYLLRDYQKERLLTFLSPERDPLGSGYHTIQSIIAVGSGKLTGKGFLEGTQTQLKFLPEQQTDFVFSALAEEWGFIGAMAVLSMFFILISLGLRISAGSRDLNGAVISFGVTAFIALAVFVNMGMVLGILPVVGVPLPFLSYGGSSTVVLMMGIGLLMNVGVRRFIFQ
ncbi:MAG: rod shape-determining protein RodA [Smithellaceae bacterium]|nr:rod shape-determining protein RodA [Smithellaceae bacterium]